MGKGLGPIQKDILKSLEKHRESNVAVVRLVEPGTSRKTRKKLLMAARRLRDKGLIEYIHVWGWNSKGRSTMVICVCLPGATIFIEERGKDIPVSELDISYADADPVGKTKDKLGKRVSKHYAALGVHLNPRDALTKGLTEDNPTEEISLEERIDRLQAKLNG